jgi:hypothetical protein
MNRPRPASAGTTARGGSTTRTTSARRSAALLTTLLAGLLTPLAACAAGAHPPQPAQSQPAQSQPTEPSTAIPSALLGQARPIGAGPRFHPPATGPVSGACTAALGAREGVHVEVFAANSVLLLPAGIGTQPPRTLLNGRVTQARCYGQLVTLDPTGVVLVRPGAALTLGALFRSWGQPLSATRLASFTAPAGSHVAVFVNGRTWPGAPEGVSLTPHAEIVLEIGPYVPPHQSYTFPPGT